MPPTSVSPQLTRCAIMILWLLKQVREPYRLGAEVPLLAEAVLNPYAYPGVQTWDCSEMVKIACQVAGLHQIGSLPVAQFDGAATQYLTCLNAGYDLPPDRAASLPGALLFIANPRVYPNKARGLGHVAISLGNGYCIEAKGRQYGVVITPITDRFNRAAKIPDLYLPLEGIHA